MENHGRKLEELLKIAHLTADEKEKVREQVRGGDVVNYINRTIRRYMADTIAKAESDAEALANARKEKKDEETYKKHLEEDYQRQLEASGVKCVTTSDGEDSSYDDQFERWVAEYWTPKWFDDKK